MNPSFWAALLLVMICISWEWWISPLRPGGSWLILKALPLGLALKGLYRRDNYTMQASSMLILLYLLEGLVRLTDPHWGSVLALIETVLSLIIFAILLIHLRPLKKAAKFKKKESESKSESEFKPETDQPIGPPLP